MNELKGKFVNIVLSIEEGRGFDSVKSKFFLTANFNGRVMESDVVEPHPNIIFNTEMVWETEKKLLRRARGAYNRIRLECYTVEKKFIGFALLCLRSAKIIPNSRTTIQVPYAWYKLFNVPTEFKKGTPELSMVLTIRDYITSNILPPALPNFTPHIETNDGEHIQIPVKYTENGFIQVGSDGEKLERYVFKITVRTASNLDTLLPENLVFTQSPKSYYLCFTIFGMDVKTKQVTRDIHDAVGFNETVVINLLSNFSILGIYFQKYVKIPVWFYNNEERLGEAEICITKMGFDVDQAVFHNWCNGKLEFEDEIYFESDILLNMDLNRKPSVCIRCCIELVNHFEEGQGEREALVSPNVRYSACQEGELLVDRGITRCFHHNLSKIEERSTNSSMISLVTNPIPSRDFNHPAENHRQYCVDIILDYIIWRRPQLCTNFNLNFMHPKANSYLNVVTEIENVPNKQILLDNSICKIIFVCGEKAIDHLLQTYKPKLQILDAFRNPIASEVTLDCSCVNITKPEFSELVTLKASNGEEIGDIHVCMFLEVCNFQNKHSPHQLLPYILDDNIIISSIAELENWKLEERSRFKNEMDRTRKTELETLHKEWFERKNKLEEDLKSNIERCKKLSRELKKNAYNLKLHKLIEERAYTDEYNVCLEMRKNQTKYALYESQELIEKISTLERDIAILKDLLGEQSLEMQEIKKSALTGEQTKNLLHDLKALEEKYEEAIRDKTYFKSEYEKMAKEVHRLKVEDHKNLQTKLATEKEQLSQLNLDTFLVMGDV